MAADVVLVFVADDSRDGTAPTPASKVGGWRVEGHPAAADLGWRVECLGWREGAACPVTPLRLSFPLPCHHAAHRHAHAHTGVDEATALCRCWDAMQDWGIG